MTFRSPLFVLAGLAAALGTSLAPAQTAPAVATPQTPQTPPTPASAQPAGLDCMIQPHLVVQVGTASPGVVQSVRVDRGDLVKRGQPVVLMKADVERAALAVARERASQSGEVTATRGAQDLAQREAQRAAQLVDENFVSRTYFDRQRAEVQVATGRGEQAQERIRLAQRELELAAAQLNQRTVLSPIDGVVVERFVSPGEYVEQKPVLRIAAVDPLRVDVLVPAAQFGRVAVGSKASVVPDLLDRRGHAAIVTSVDRVVDAASNTFRVRLELPNPGGVLPPGLRCKAELGMTAAADARPVLPTAASLPVPAPAAAQLTSLPPATQAKHTNLPPATQAQVRRTEPVERVPASPPVWRATATAVATAEVRRTEPVEPATVERAPRRPPAASPSYAEIRRTEPVEPAAVPLPRAAQDAAALARAPQGAAMPAVPAVPRLKMAPIEWPTAVAVAAPLR